MVGGEQLRVGFIGMGDQGAPMARRILAAGFPLAVWARRAATTEPFTAAGATVATSPKALGAVCDVVGLCVLADDDVRQVTLGPEGVLAGMAAGSALLLHSTIHPDTAREVAAAGADRGVDVLDAPVSGGSQLAEEGRLVVMVGGNPEAFARVEPVMASFGTTVRLLGDVGAGSITKLINNTLMAVNFSTGELGLALAEQLGADRTAVAEVVAQASGGTVAMQSLARMGGSVGPFATSRGGALLLKDARILEALARQAGADPDDLMGAAALLLAPAAEVDMHPGTPAA